jgi:hypothetical protein
MGSRSAHDDHRRKGPSLKLQNQPSKPPSNPHELLGGLGLHLADALART